MVNAQAHRGPDDHGIETVATTAGALRESTIVLGHRRLSIIDLSAAGHQPMVDLVTKNWITYNGEIYNFMELRDDLSARGHQFRSRSDTEVILKAYAEWGIGCWRRLRGIFAFGLWDAGEQQLHLVRDHLGVKPLYYARTPAGLVFASEVRALLASECLPRRLDFDAAVSFLKYGSVQEPTTLVAGVTSLPPGHYLNAADASAIAVRHFWSAREALVRNRSERSDVALVRPVLEDSVRRQMVADVPVGVFLSGGVDSAVVASLAASAHPGNVHTFCVGSDEKRNDESAEAAETAATLGCVHTSLVLEAGMVRQRFNAVLASYDQPSLDGLNSYFISMLVRKAGIKVALSGLGGDELFVGYNGFRKAMQMEHLGRCVSTIPPGIRRFLGHTIGRLGPLGAAIPAALSEILEPDLASPYFASRTVFSRDQIGQLCGATRSVEDSRSVWRERERQLAHATKGLEDIDRISFLELHTYMLSTLLRDADQMSMAHGLELRVPFIDSQVVEQVLPIAASEKIGNGRPKKLLIDAVADLIPRHLLARRKRGFNLPFQQWFRRDLEEPMNACFHAAQVKGPWDPRRFRAVWAGFCSGRVSWSRVMALFVLECWMQENQITA